MISEKKARALLAVGAAFEKNACDGNAMEVLCRLDGICEKQAFLRLMKIVDEGWIDYGVHVRRAWLTPEGSAALDAAFDRHPEWFNSKGQINGNCGL